MANAKKLPSGNWRVRLFVGERNGKKVYKSFTAESKKEAERLAALYVYREEENVGTVKTAIDNYIVNRTGVLSPSSIRGYRIMQRNNFGEIENKKIDRLTSEDVQIFINNLSSEKSPKTVRNIYALLKASIEAAAPGKTIDVDLPQKKIIERNIPTKDDIKNLLEHSNKRLRIAILLAANGTLRAGEVCALCYEDIQNETIHVHMDMVRNESNEWVIKDIPKTSSSDRYISLPKEIIKEIGKGKGSILNTNPGALTSAYYKLAKKLGIKSTRFHDLRHFAASYAHSVGIPDQYIMARGGWSSDAILKSVYRNILDDERMRFEDKINGSMRGDFF